MAFYNVDKYLNIQNKLNTPTIQIKGGMDIDKINVDTINGGVVKKILWAGVMDYRGRIIKQTGPLGRSDRSGEGVNGQYMVYLPKPLPKGSYSVNLTAIEDRDEDINDGLSIAVTQVRTDYFRVITERAGRVYRSGFYFEVIDISNWD